VSDKAPACNDATRLPYGAAGARGSVSDETPTRDGSKTGPRGCRMAPRVRVGR
jgi:hypothetical protein